MHKGEGKSFSRLQEPENLSSVPANPAKRIYFHAWKGAEILQLAVGMVDSEN